MFWLLPEGAEELRGFVSDLLQSDLGGPSEAGLTALAVFDVFIQTVLQGGADGVQPAEREAVIHDNVWDRVS